MLEMGDTTPKLSIQFKSLHQWQTMLVFSNQINHFYVLIQISWKKKNSDRFNLIDLIFY